MAVHISTGISKMGGMALAIGLPPEDTCRPDAPCKKGCYARKGRYNMKVVQKNLRENLNAWKRSHKKFEQAIVDACINCKWFRWFHAGDIVCMAFLIMMVHVALRVPSTNFLAFTKKFEIVNKYLDKHDLPPNLSIILSAWGNFIPDNPHNLPMAFVRFKDGPNDKIPTDAIPCNGSCAECIMRRDGGCWKLKRGQSVVFDFH